MAEPPDASGTSAAGTSASGTSASGTSGSASSAGESPAGAASVGAVSVGAASAEVATARRSRRWSAVIALAAVVGAVAMAAAAGLTWWSQPFDDSLTGRIDAQASGAAALPELVPVALVVLAGLGATLATRGVARRLVGLLLAAAGLLVVVRSVLALSTPPAALAGQLVRPADAAAAATGHPVGPLLALLGALAVTAAGVLVLLGRGAGRRRALGARYERHRTTAGSGPAVDAEPAVGSAVAGRTATGGAAAMTQPAGAADDSSRGSAGDADARTVDWWNQLDAGADPTAARSVDAPGAQSREQARSEPDDPARPSQDSTERELG